MNLSQKFLQADLKESTSNELKLIIVCDNASIHKSRDWFKFYKDSGINLLTIPSYKSALNPAEKLILVIKTKSNKMKGR